MLFVLINVAAIDVFLFFVSGVNWTLSSIDVAQLLIIRIIMTQHA